MTDQNETGGSLNLSLPVDDIREEVSAPVVEQVEVVEQPVFDPEVEKLADGFLAQLVAATEGEARGQSRRAVDDMGVDLQKQSAYRSQMLREPISKLMEKGNDGGPVANALVALQNKTRELDPNRFDFTVSFLARLFSFLPGVGNKLQTYFMRYESAQNVLDNIIKDLEAGREMLRRDNHILTDDQEEFRALGEKLGRQIEVGRALDHKLAAHVESLDQAEPKRQFLQEEIQFPLRQRIQDLQQQQIVNQQGVLSLELIVRNNRELIRGVDRAINVTVAALNVAVTVALALANQKLVLGSITALNETTSDLIAGTASQLRTQGVEIQKQASAAALDMDALKSAFGDITAAIDEISDYRQKALPQMAHQIDELGVLAAAGQQAVDRLADGRAAQDRLKFVEDDDEDGMDFDRD